MMSTNSVHFGILLKLTIRVKKFENASFFPPFCSGIDKGLIYTFKV